MLFVNFITPDDWMEGIGKDRTASAFLCLLSCLLLAQSFAGREVYALCDHYKASLKRQLHFIISKNPKYTWEAQTTWTQAWIVPAISTSHANGPASPDFRPVVSHGSRTRRLGRPGHRPDESDECDLPFWTSRKSGRTATWEPSSDTRMEGSEPLSK